MEELSQIDRSTVARSLLKKVGIQKFLDMDGITEVAVNQGGFNTQPPEGGCSLHKKARKISKLNTVFR